MAHIVPPPIDQLPSASRLRRAFVAALAFAGVLIVAVILPAERAIDPTGIGNVLGLTEMGLIKKQFKAEVAALRADSIAQRIADSTTAADKAAVLAALASGQRPAHTDTTTLTVRPGEEAGVEFTLARNAWATYEWSSASGLIDFDVRGDSTGAPEWWYHRYESASNSTSGSGVLVARFSGTHGFYWKNTSDSLRTVRVISRGNYGELRPTPPKP
jgi:hypothetical protein